MINKSASNKAGWGADRQKGISRCPFYFTALALDKTQMWMDIFLYSCFEEIKDHWVL